VTHSKLHPLLTHKRGMAWARGEKAAYIRSIQTVFVVSWRYLGMPLATCLELVSKPRSLFGNLISFNMCIPAVLMQASRQWLAFGDAVLYNVMSNLWMLPLDHQNCASRVVKFPSESC